MRPYRSTHPYLTVPTLAWTCTQIATLPAAFRNPHADGADPDDPQVLILDPLPDPLLGMFFAHLRLFGPFLHPSLLVIPPETPTLHPLIAPLLQTWPETPVYLQRPTPEDWQSAQQVLWLLDAQDVSRFY